MQHISFTLCHCCRSHWSGVSCTHTSSVCCECPWHTSWAWPVACHTKSSAVAETVRRFMSLNILLRPLEMTLLSKACAIPISIPLKLCLYLLSFLRFSVSKDGMTLKLGLGVVQGHWKRAIR